jgi:hypothetical protein
MSKALRIAGATALIFVFVLSITVLVQPAAQAGKRDYACCRYVVKDPTGVRIAKGVWIQGKCHCTVFSPDENPNGCPLYCPPPL